MESMGIIADTSELIKKDIPLLLPWARVGVKCIRK